MRELKFELRSQKSTPDGLVMYGCMVFHYIVSHISGSQAPIVAEFSLGCSTSDPVELHVHGLESPACNVLGYDAQ